MSPLEAQLADYLRIRRALGYRLERAEKLLRQYVVDRPIAVTDPRS
jgi:hypothetical protein